MLKIGIESDAYFGFDDFEQGMHLMKEHGYDGFDYQELGSVPNSPLYKMSDDEMKAYLTKVKDCAKKNGLDAIHDTVHEMARDEARHGKGLEGLLKRYFA